MALLSVGDRFPKFNMRAVKPGLLRTVDAYRADDYFMQVSNRKDYPEQWTVLFFWPKNFSVVCPTEITAFAYYFNKLDQLNTRVIGVTTDNEFSSLAWRRMQPELRNIPFPIAADLDRKVSTECGALGKAGICDRVTFILDPDDIIQYVCVTASNVGRSVKETIRQIQALQTNEYCTADWQSGDKCLNPLDELKEY